MFGIGLAMPSLMPGMPGLYGIIASTYEKIRASVAIRPTLAMNDALRRPEEVL